MSAAEAITNRLGMAVLVMGEAAMKPLFMFDRAEALDKLNRKPCPRSS